MKTKQERLHLPNHTTKLIQDVSTRWNSSHDMVERYLDMTVRQVKEVIKVCKPSEDSYNTDMHSTISTSVSMVLPAETTILKCIVASDEDDPAIEENLEPTYADPSLQDLLHKSIASHPHFKSLLYLDDATHLRVYNKLTAEIVTNRYCIYCVNFNIDIL